MEKKSKNRRGVGLATPPRGIFLSISLEPVELQTSNLYQIVALNVLMKKGHWVHVAKINTLGAMGQNVDLLAKMPKIVVFWASPTGIFENRIFFHQNFSLGI